MCVPIETYEREKLRKNKIIKMSGILYGKKNIPLDWLNDLVKEEYLENICNNFESKVNKKILHS